MHTSELKLAKSYKVLSEDYCAYQVHWGSLLYFWNHVAINTSQNSREAETRFFTTCFL